MSALKIEFSSAVRNLPRACSKLTFGETLVVLDGRYFNAKGIDIYQIRDKYNRSSPEVFAGREKFGAFLNEHYHGFRFAVKRAALMPRESVDVLPDTPKELAGQLDRMNNAHAFLVYSDICTLEGGIKRYIAFRDPRLAF